MKEYIENIGKYISTNTSLDKNILKYHQKVVVVNKTVLN